LGVTLIALSTVVLLTVILSDVAFLKVILSDVVELYQYGELGVV